MTGKCLSRKRSIPSNSMYACNDVFSAYFSKSISLSYNKAYNFQVNVKKDTNSIIYWR